MLKEKIIMKNNLIKNMEALTIEMKDYFHLEEYGSMGTTLDSYKNLVKLLEKQVSAENNLDPNQYKALDNHIKLFCSMENNLLTTLIPKLIENKNMNQVRKMTDILVIFQYILSKIVEVIVSGQPDEKDCEI